MLDHLSQTDQCRKYLQAALLKDPQLGEAQVLLAKLDAPAANPVQQAAFTESAKPVAPEPIAPPPAPPAPPAPPTAFIEAPAAPAPNLPQAAGPSVLLPATPRILIHYENTPAAAP